MHGLAFLILLLTAPILPRLASADAGNTDLSLTSTAKNIWRGTLVGVTAFLDRVRGLGLQPATARSERASMGDEPIACARSDADGAPSQAPFLDQRDANNNDMLAVRLIWPNDSPKRCLLRLLHSGVHRGLFPGEGSET